MKIQKLPPIHPGKILLEEFLEPMGITQYRLAKDTSVPPRRINEIVHQKRSITADTALRLGVFFNMSPHFWMNLGPSLFYLLLQEGIERYNYRIHAFCQIPLNGSKRNTICSNRPGVKAILNVYIS